MKKDKNKPPVLGKKLLKWALPSSERESITGDYEELYVDLSETKGFHYARIWYWLQVIRSLWTVFTFSINWNFIMLRNYMKIAFRTMIKQRVYSFINITGLAIGIAGSTLLAMWVVDELSYDRFFKDSDNIYRIITVNKNSNKVSNIARSAPPVAPAIKKEIPEILNSTRYFDNEQDFVIKYDNKSYSGIRAGAADPDFFGVFSYNILKGNPETALTDLNSIILTEDLSRKIFGEEDPLGKTVNMFSRDIKVTGIMQDVPVNSHLRFDCIYPMIFWREFGIPFDDWKNPIFNTYVLLNDNSASGEINRKINECIKTHEPGITSSLYLQPLERIHLFSNFQWDIKGHGDIKYVYIISAMSLFILLIACINYINLTTARAGIRSREIGMRKVVGAQRKNIVYQFLGESVFLSFLAVVFAAFLILYSLQEFNELSGKNFSLSFFGSFYFITGLICITLLTGLVSGIYPALYISHFQPAAIFKRLLHTGKTGSKGTLFRKILVVTQFTITISLIVCAAVVYFQLNFIMHKDLGYDREHLVYFNSGVRDFKSRWKPVKSEFLKNPDIFNATLVANIPTKVFNGTNDINWEGRVSENNTVIHEQNVGYDFINTFKMKIVQGRFFSKEYASDSTMAYVVNEEAVKVMGMKNPVGKQFSLRGRAGRIIGVIKNFHHGSLHTAIEPVALRIGHRYKICLRINDKNIPETIKYITGIYKSFNPDAPLQYYFFNETIDSFYKSEQRISLIFKYFTVISIFIACIGLFGLTSFMIEQRTKEIGIRKVLGASSTGIVLLMSREFTGSIILANLIAWPAAWYTMNKWLGNFAYKIDPGISIFLLSGLSAFLIAFITICFQAVKAARSNPVNALKYE